MSDYSLYHFESDVLNTSDGVLYLTLLSLGVFWFRILSRSCELKPLTIGQLRVFSKSSSATGGQLEEILISVDLKQHYTVNKLVLHI